MALTDFQAHFDNTYEDIFNKVLVGKEIANFRFEPTLKFGESVERFSMDLSAVRVRTVVRGSTSSIDAITDTTELLTINTEKESAFYLSDGEVTQAGPLNPGEYAGKNIAMKVAADLDSRILYETLSATSDFDTGDLTTLVSTGVSFALDATNTPLFITRAPSKLLRNNIIFAGDLVFVTDSLGVASLEQYLLSKSIDLAGSVFANGYAGTVHGAQIYTSENLTSEFVLTDSGTFSDGETFTIGSVTFTMKTALSSGPAIAGEIVIGSDLAASMTNIAAAVNDPNTTSATFTALSATNANLITDTYKLTATASATTVTFVAMGAGRLVLAETGGSTSWSSNFLHCYFGKKGAIDVVVQDLSEVDIRKCSDKRGSNFFTSYLAGIKTFADGAKKFLDVLITC